MVYKSGTDPQSLRHRRGLAHALKTMPHWKRKILVISMVIGCIGVSGHAASFLAHGSTPATPQTAQPLPAVPGTGTGTPPGGSSGFVSGQPVSSTPSASAPAQTSPPAPDSGLTQALTPFMTHVGFSLFVGVIVGLIFRTFLRMALTITALIVAAAMALSYFHINVDLTAVKTNASQATSWLSDQGYRLKDMLFNALPSSTAAGIGFFLGLKRR